MVRQAQEARVAGQTHDGIQRRAMRVGVSQRELGQRLLQIGDDTLGGQQGAP